LGTPSKANKCTLNTSLTNFDAVFHSVYILTITDPTRGLSGSARNWH